ncbi:MAG: hypothetical protein JWO58_2162 [Chitinophagaceae bacterium]|nr:hypothetical protein [Chitinophagaceae bacterium]
MMRTIFISLLSLLFHGATMAQTTVINFDVIFGGNTIGTLTATREIKGTQVIKNLRSNTDAKVLMLSVHVESEVHLKTESEVLTAATSYRHANRGAEDIETSVNKESGTQYKVIKNGTTKIITNSGIKFCVTDLYFKEPVGITTAFSNTYGEFLSVKPKGKGIYTLVLPDGKTTVFNYVNGKLTQMEANISVGTILFKRK